MKPEQATAAVHATCVLLGKAGAAFGAPEDAGVLLCGASGAGKSAVALELIARGAKLVADDRTELFVKDGLLFGRAPLPIAGLVEAREVGIVRLPFAKRARIALVVELRAGPRLPEHRRFRPPAAIKLPAAAAPPTLKIARDAATATKIALAAAAYERNLHREAIETI
jgi:HPr kinase/phosphorylase